MTSTWLVTNTNYMCALFKTEMPADRAPSGQGTRLGCSSGREAGALVSTGDSLRALRGHVKQGFSNSNPWTCCIKITWGSPDWCGSVGWAHPIKWKVMGLIPGQGTRLGCGFYSQSGQVQEANNWCFSLMWVFFSLSFSLPSPLPKNK